MVRKAANVIKLILLVAIWFAVGYCFVEALH